MIAHVGDVLFYPAGLTHHESSHGNALLEFYCLQFEWADCPSDMPNVIADRQGRVLELVRWLNSDCLPYYEGNKAYMRLLTSMLVAELLRLVVSPSQEVVDQVRGYVTDRLTNHMQLDDLASHCKLNKFHLVRKFRALTGRAPMEYVRDVRLETALQMLLETDLPLREVAPRVGFSDEYHLSRLLKKRYGVGARELRKRLKTDSAWMPEDSTR